MDVYSILQNFPMICPLDTVTEQCKHLIASLLFNESSRDFELDDESIQAAHDSDENIVSNKLRTVREVGRTGQGVWGMYNWSAGVNRKNGRVL